MLQKFQNLFFCSNIDEIIEIKFLDIFSCNSSISYHIQCVEFSYRCDFIADAYVWGIVTELPSFGEVKLKTDLLGAIAIELQRHTLHKLG